MSNNNNKFWVIIEDAYGAKTGKKYGIFEEAKTEAEKLCESTGNTFFILEATESISYPKPNFKWEKI